MGRAKPEDWRDAALETIAKVVKESGVSAYDIKGLGISGQMHGLVMLDENGEVIRPSIIWCDQRTEKSAKKSQKKSELKDLLRLLQILHLQVLLLQKSSG